MCFEKFVITVKIIERNRLLAERLHTYDQPLVCLCAFLCFLTCLLVCLFPCLIVSLIVWYLDCLFPSLFVSFLFSCLFACFLACLLFACLLVCFQMFFAYLLPRKVCVIVICWPLSAESFRVPQFRYGPDKEGFSLGSALKNVEQVLGLNKWYWFLPVFTR